MSGCIEIVERKSPFIKKHNHAFVRNDTLDQIIGILGFIQSVKLLQSRYQKTFRKDINSRM